MASHRGYGKKIKTRVYGIYGGTVEHPPPCYACGRPAESIDHIVPVALGGTDEIDNLRPACISCNSRGGAHLVNASKPKKTTPALSLIHI